MIRVVTIGWTFALVSTAFASDLLSPLPMSKWSRSGDSFHGARPRIYNANEVKDGQFPFMIFTLIERRAFGDSDSLILSCSSSLVSPRWVLTAAHCVDSPDITNMILTGGRSDLKEYIEDRIAVSFEKLLDEKKYGIQERLSKTYFINPNFRNDTYEHDIALIWVKKPFVLGDMVSTIPLSTEKMVSKKFCTIVGWGNVRGNVRPNKLNFADWKQVSTTEIGCRRPRSGLFICLIPDDRGICEGDSGGPLVCDCKLWGVASHMWGPSSDCGTSTEELYVDTYHDLDWIQSHIENDRASGGGGGIASSGLLSCLLVFVLISMYV